MQVYYQHNTIDLSIRYKQNSSTLIFFIHGGGCTKESFDDVWNRKEIKDYSLCSVDLVGHGASSKLENFSYDLASHAQVLKLLLKKLEFQTLHIVGHSTGGAIGLLLIDILQTVHSFVSIEGNMIGADCGLISRGTVSVPFDEFKKNKLRELQDTMNSRDEIGAHLWVQWAQKASPLGFYKTMESTVKWSDSGKLLAKFNTLRLKKKYFYGLKNADSEVIQYLNQADIIGIKNSGHFVMNDNPEDFYDSLFAFLNRK